MLPQPHWSARQVRTWVSPDGDLIAAFSMTTKVTLLKVITLLGCWPQRSLLSPTIKSLSDPRLTWNTIDVAKTAGGSAEQSKPVNTFIKETMRRVDAVYGGEMSAHHYFRDFAYCDSGMIPWLLVAEIMSTTGKTLASLVEERTKHSLLG